MRTVTYIVPAMLAAIALVGCGGGGNQAAAPTGFAANQSVEAYSYTHGGYVGQAIAETDGEGNLEVTIDEAFLPHTLAGVDFESDQWTEENTATYTVRDEVNYVARWVEYEGTVYVGTTVGTTLVYVPANDEGNPAGDVNQDNLEMSIIRNEDTMSAWYDNIAEGSFATYTEFGGEATPVETTQYGSLTKRGSSYWDFGLGWQGNMDAIEDAAEEYGVRFSLDEMVRTDEGTWNLADATTAATASDFPDYFGVVQKAVARLEMQ